VEVKGYFNLWMIFSDEQEIKIILVRYIMLNASSSYNILLTRPSLNKLGAITSTVHLKMKFPTEARKVVTMRVNRKVSKKCYENGLRARRTTYYITSLTQSKISS